MPTAKKTAAIDELQETFQGAAAIFLADFTGLNVEDMTSLRRKCRENDIQLQVVKNTLAIKASRKLELSELEPHFKGPTALAVAKDDPTSPARVLVAFHKEHDKPQVKLGFVDGRVLSAEEVTALATLPTRDELISQVMQLALAPAQKFVGTLNEVLSQVVRVVDAVRDAKEKGTIASPEAAPAEEAPVAAAPEAAAAEAEESKDEPAAEENPAEESAPEEDSSGSEEPESK